MAPSKVTRIAAYRANADPAIGTICPVGTLGTIANTIL